ncbi:Tfx family DNA-binding protein, partial [Candidatus Bathyarchaeota archaeon]|nr:Tfx family DNA-binding protein [Candidatus Bathyarchaeota archaeon]
MSRKRRGLLTESQIGVYKLRLSGMSQEDIALRLGTTRQNVSMLERRARRNIGLAEDTLKAYKEIVTATSVKVEPGTHLVDVPRLLVSAADGAGVKLRGDFSRIYNIIRFNAPGYVEG